MYRIQGQRTYNVSVVYCGSKRAAAHSRALIPKAMVVSYALPLGGACRRVTYERAKERYSAVRLKRSEFA
jgi:hypothetical protein